MYGTEKKLGGAKILQSFQLLMLYYNVCCVCIVFSAATLIKQNYPIEDFTEETKVPSSLRKAVEKFAADPDLKLVSIIV